MGDRTNIADALEREALAEAARLLSADPDTEPDGEMPEAFSVVLDELIAVEPDDGFSREDVARAIVGMLQSAGLLTGGRADPDTSDELFTEARQLLDRWDALDLSDIVDDARPLIAALLERAVTAEADLRALSTRTTGDSKVDLRMLYAYEAGIMERDAERAARERAETEARQLREAIEDRLRQVLAVHGQFLGDWDEWTSLGALEGYNGLTVTARTALAHLHGQHDDSPLPTMHCVLCETFRVPAVAEGAEDRGQTTTPDGSDE